MILCVGTTPAVQRSMVLKQLTVDEVNRALAVRETAAGKGINVARVLTLLGRKALATGFIGGDTGAFVLRELDREKIPHRYIEVPFRTRTCVTLMDQTAGTTTELVEESSSVEEKHWRQLENLIQEVLPQCRAMVLSGVLPPGSGKEFYATCAQVARARGVPVIVDSKGDPLRLALSHRPVLVKPNRSELAATLGLSVDMDEHLKDAIRRLIGMGAQAALITMGDKGAVLSDGKEFWSIGTPRVETSNPIGSGDAVAAGFAAGVIDGLSLRDCAVLGIACGAANAMTDIPGFVRREDVVRLEREISVTEF